MPTEWQENMPATEPEASRHIADFLAGMTDRYATNRYEELNAE
jgi:dGTPase